MNITHSEKPLIGLMIAAPNSGSGKTVVTLALLRALRDIGLNIAGAKTGPDFIDPQFHNMASGKASINLDPWAMDEADILGHINPIDGSHILVEAMMGLYDGAADGSATSADLAAILGVNIVLVVNAAKQSHSIAALAQGFRNFRKDITIAGVILNQVGSPRHEAMLRSALAAINVPVFGAIPCTDKLAIPERHLGLMQIDEIAEFEGFIVESAQVVTENCDLDRLISEFSPLKSVETPGSPGAKLFGSKIAIARDVAFSFIYPHLVNSWERQGATISYFSPLANEGPNTNADAVYLPGGYPELHAERLANNQNFKSEMRAAKDRGTLIYGECGGYMVLGKSIRDQHNISQKMLGFLDLETSFSQRKLSLGYREMHCCDGQLGAKNWRGHEFHYSTIIHENGEPLFSVCDALGEKLGEKGLRNGNVMGSYMHLIGPAS